jgi:hypothetical protein
VRTVTPYIHGYVYFFYLPTVPLHQIGPRNNNVDRYYVALYFAGDQHGSNNQASATHAWCSMTGTSVKTTLDRDDLCSV